MSSNIDFVTEKNLDGAGCLNWDSIPRNVSEEITVDGCVIKHFPEKGSVLAALFGSELDLTG